MDDMEAKMQDEKVKPTQKNVCVVSQRFDTFDEADIARTKALKEGKYSKIKIVRRGQKCITDGEVFDLKLFMKPQEKKEQPKTKKSKGRKSK